ncbi:mechanosensitive ion channel domain-containing protein [Microcoleus sp.]|uniref:mechanosensitive ion channel family protein n=1 Tax=Microcoleus sp. TaxID=44472 RepID=UPI0035268FAF
MKNNKMLPKRVRAIFLIGVVSCFALWGMPARSQEAAATASEEATASPKAEKIEPPPKADPKAAVTTKDPEIPVEELQLLVKPLTLDELQNEAAAWELLLQNKVKEISDAEIAIKRQNRSINKQQEVAGSLDEAKKALEESEKALKSAAPDSAEYKEATKKAEEAKDKLKKAQEGLKEATKTKKELKQDDTLNNALKKAEKTGEVDRAKQTLDEAKQEREKIAPDSPAYTAATEKIDALDKAIKADEDAEKAQKAIADPKSPEYQEATKKLEEATAQVKKAREAISGASTTGGTGAAEKSAQKLDEATSTLENTKIKTGGETGTAGSSAAANSQANQDKKGQLAKTSDKLQANAKDESALKNQLVVNATNLQSGRTAVVDRFNVILEELDRKGGDSKYYRKYIEAITKAEIDVKDTEGLGVRVLSWFKSDEGGLRWVSNIGKFVGIVLASAIVSQIVGFVISKLLKLSNTSKLMRQFTVVVINRGGIVVGVLLALTALEVSLAPVLTVLGGASFIFAFALQSNLGNFASGLMLMLYKPFDVGDEVKIGSLWGWVDSISLANTKIKGFGGQMFTVPNNTVWSDTIENLTTSDIRKVRFSFRISFDQDVTNIEKVLVDIFKSHPQILEEPAPSTFVFDLEDEYINLKASGWAKTDEFWKVSADIIRTIQTRFEQEGVKLGAPAQDIRILPESDENNSLTLDREFTEKQLLHPETAKPALK